MASYVKYKLVKYKIPVILTLLILIPLLLLAWLGLRLQHNTAIVAEHQFQQLIDAQLRQADQVIISYFTQLEDDLLNTPDFVGSDAGSPELLTIRVRAHLRRSPILDNLFVLDAAGQRLYPPANKLASQKERQFVQNTQALWSNMDAFRPTAQADVAKDKVSATPSVRKLEQVADNTRFSVSGALSKLNSRRQKARSDVLYDSDRQDSAPPSTPSSKSVSSRVASNVLAEEAATRVAELSLDSASDVVAVDNSVVDSITADSIVAETTVVENVSPQVVVLVESEVQETVAVADVKQLDSNQRGVEQFSVEVEDSEQLVSRKQKESASTSVPALAPVDAAWQAQTERFGWTVWYVGTETQTFFWFWDRQNNLIGLKLSAVQWLSELLNQLPDDRDAEQLIGTARIKLLNEKQSVLYQWGNFDDASENAEPQGQRLLSHPLAGWRLAYFSPPANTAQTLQQGFYLGLLALLGLVLGCLAFYMWREYRRDMRIAQQRVTFVNQVSHELKTPLTNICLYTELLESQVADQALSDQDVDPSLVKKYAGVLTAESQRLGRLINNVLRFSQLQREQLPAGVSVQEASSDSVSRSLSNASSSLASDSAVRPLHFQAGVVDETIAQTVQMFAPAFAAKGIVVELDLQAKQTVQFDAEALEQIINNLLGNIEKYAHQGKQALVRSVQQQNDATMLTTIFVEDAGAGIDDKLAKRLFEPFSRGSSELTEGVSGTGIGLSIARDLCRLHGGDLQLLSAQKTSAQQTSLSGACFVVTLSTPAMDVSDEA